MDSNRYNSENHRTLAYYIEDLSWLFGKDDWDRDNEGYTETVRYRLNKDGEHAGTRRQYSLVMLENGYHGSRSQLTNLEFIVEFKTLSPFAMRIHGSDIVLSGILSIAQLNQVMLNLGNADNGSEFSVRHVTDTHGIRIVIRVVNLRQGKRNEVITLSSDDTLKVKDTLRNFERLPKKYKRNRKSLS
jgi:hypothetical protein